MTMTIKKTFFSINRPEELDWPEFMKGQDVFSATVTPMDINMKYRPNRLTETEAKMDKNSD